MKKLSVDEVKKIELEILSFFADYCEHNCLKYYLTYGTLIGAIRHKGFIPWDDDVDVAMPRDDYEKLIASFNNQSDRKKYRLISPFDKDSRHSIVKIIDTSTVKCEQGVTYEEKIGIDIDVFPIDGVPSDDQEFQIWYKKLIRLYDDYFVYNRSIDGAILIKLKILIKKTLVIIKYRSLSKNKCLLLAEELHKLYPVDRCEYVGIFECCDNGPKNKVQKSWYEGEAFTKFEGKDFRIPAEYDAILKGIYGDYMKLPPENKRTYGHSYEAYLIV